jgi:DNA-binding YbaB/EbfC family protein
MRRGGLASASPGGNAFAQAQEMLAKAQEELASAEVEGSSGGGAVRVRMTGDQKIAGITLQPEVVDPEDVEMLQDLIMAAIADASERANEIQSRSLGSITGSLGIPGLS